MRLARLAACTAALLAAPQTVPRSRDGRDVASLNLSCAPAVQGLRCQLMALFRDVGLTPQDVTSVASWRLSGLVGAWISRDGAIDATGDGDVDIEAQFHSHRVEAHGRLHHGAPGQMLAALRGCVYVEVDGRLQPAPYARVEVVGGTARTTISTTTLGDGTYEFRGLVPGEVAVRATKAGFTATGQSTEIHAGDNRLSLVFFPAVTKLQRRMIAS